MWRLVPLIPTDLTINCYLGRPTKIVDMSTSKTGKHGHAKVKLVALDVRGLYLRRVPRCSPSR